MSDAEAVLALLRTFGKIVAAAAQVAEAAFESNT
jgi:hypothetical protein